MNLYVYGSFQGIVPNTAMPQNFVYGSFALQRTHIQSSSEVSYMGPFRALFPRRDAPKLRLWVLCIAKDPYTKFFRANSFAKYRFQHLFGAWCFARALPREPFRESPSESPSMIALPREPFHEPIGQSPSFRALFSRHDAPKLRLWVLCIAKDPYTKFFRANIFAKYRFQHLFRAWCFARALPREPFRESPSESPSMRALPREPFHEPLGQSPSIQSSSEVSCMAPFRALFPRHDAPKLRLWVLCIAKDPYTKFFWANSFAKYRFQHLFRAWCFARALP